MCKKKQDYHYFAMQLERARAAAFDTAQLVELKATRLKQASLADSLFNRIVEFVNDGIGFHFERFITDVAIAKAMANEAAIVYDIDRFAQKTKATLIFAQFASLSTSSRERLKVETQAVILQRLIEAQKYIANDDNPAIRFELEKTKKLFDTSRKQEEAV